MAGARGGDTVTAELELDSRDVKDVQGDETVDVEARSVKNADSDNPEPMTTRWELWAWYTYYFGNNSTGTLSYAPLSMTPFSQTKLGLLTRLVFQSLLS